MTTRTTYILAILVVFTAASFVTAVVARDQFFNYDEAYNLNASKTLASTGMYATELNHEYVRFDPTVTSGPSVVVPMALAIRLFGSTPGVVRGALIVLFIIYLAMAFWAATEIVGKLAGFAFLLVMTTTPYVLSLGVSAQGDLPSICLALFSLALFDRADRVPGKRPRLLTLAAGGLSLGLAVLAKDILMLLVFARIAVISIDFLKRKTRSRAVGHGIAIVIALGMVLGWRGYQYLTMRLAPPEEFAKWMAIAKDISNMLRTHIVYQPLSHTWVAWQQSLEFFAPYLLSFILGLLAIGVLRYLFRVPVKWLNWESSAQKTLLAAAGLWCFWYFILSGPDASNRHLLPGIVFLELLAVNFAHQLWAFRLAPSTDSPDRPAAGTIGDSQPHESRQAFGYAYPIAAIVTGVMIWGVWYGVTYNRGAYLEGKRILGAQLETAKWVKSNIPKDSAISGWGWFVPWHISFLADRMPARANIHTASLEGMTDWLVIPPEISAEGPNKRRESFLERQAHLEFSNGGYQIYRVSHRPEDQPQTPDQLKAILSSAKNWKAAGHNYSELNRARAIADGVVPVEMIIHNGIQNLFGGPVDIGPAPANTGIPDTFLVLFSGVPNEDCVKLAFPGPDGYVVYAGDYLKIAASEDQARSLCKTGNMWFVAK